MSEASRGSGSHTDQHRGRTKRAAHADDPFGAERGVAPRHGGRTRAFVAAVLHWRSWRLPVKLAAVALVPVIFAVTVSAMAIDAHLTRAGQYATLDARVAAGQQIRAVITAAQRERNRAAVAQGTGEGDAGKAQRPLDDAVADARGSMARLSDLPAVAAARWQEANSQLRTVPSLRARWQDGPDVTIAGYSDAIGSLLALERALAGSGAGADLSRSAGALYDLDGATEQVYHEQALVLAGITRGHMSANEVDGLRAAEARRTAKVADFRALSSVAEQRDYDRAVAGPQINQRRSYLQQAIASASSDGSTNTTGNSTVTGSGTARGQGSQQSLTLRASAFNASSDATTAKLSTFTGGMAMNLRSRAAQLRQQAFDGALVAAVVLLVALMLATAVAWVVARQLVSSIRVLYGTAKDVARRQIPQVVSDIGRGAPVTTEIEPVPLATDDEVGRLARAFDAVHGVARGLAVEQAELRSGYGSVFVNLSRRSQSLVQRQLRLLEQLERDEEDPDQLSTLFQLDHLATRMRRNNENLMVLSGSSSAKGTAQAPTPVGDLLRAAVSEIELYRRVTLHMPPVVHLVGYATSDLVRLLAELLDNATAFSAPDTQVTVSTHQQSEGALEIDIVDEGIGMSDDDLADANRRLAASGPTDLPVSRRMGLFVVGRLARSHGVGVELHGGAGIEGLRASVTVPADLVAGTQPPPQPGAVVPPESDLERTLAGTGFSAIPAMPGWTGTALAEQPPARSTAIQGPAVSRVPDSGTSALGGASGAGLFAATNDTAGSAKRSPLPAPRPRSEKTPIFDEMISVWFDPDAASRGGESGGRSETVTPEAGKGDTPGHGDAARWQFDADNGWRVAREVSESRVEETTSAGLPKRVPKARLVPGHASGELAAVEAASRDPLAVHDRLAGFQHGIASGRHAGSATVSSEPDTGDESSSSGQDVESDAVTGATDADAEGVDASDAGAIPTRREPELHHSGLPQRTPQGAMPAAEEPDAVTAEEPVPEPASVEPSPPEDAWQFAADTGWEAVARVADEAESAATAAELTPAGLPRRQPKAHLLPGSAGDASAQGAGGRDAAGVRDRMASFQRGIKQGRENVPASSEESGDQ